MTEVQRNKNAFFGLSSLREKEKAASGPSEKAKELEQYLASKYASSEDTKKKRKKKKAPAAQAGVQILDLDNTGFHDKTAPIRGPSSRRQGRLALDDDEEEDAPVVANPGEALRLQQIAQRERAGASALGWQQDAGVPAPKRARHDSPDLLPPRKAPAPDLAPPQNAPVPGLSPPRRAAPDLSPPRARRPAAPELSPAAQAKPASGDSSPPRRPRGAAPDLSPPRARRSSLPEGGPSTSGRPAQARAPVAGSPDLGNDVSPPRRSAARDLSPPRKSKPGDRDAAFASRREHRRAAADASPPRRRGKDPNKADTAQRSHRHSTPPRQRAAQQERTMADGQRAGLVRATELQQHLQAKKAAEKAKFDALGESTTGQGAATIYRDAQGQKVDLEELRRLQEAEQAAKKKPKAEPPEWGKGIKQMHEREQHWDQLRREAAKPFARTRDDADLEASLRERTRFGDPMSGLVRKPAAAQLAPAIPEHMLKRMKKSGFHIPQEVPPHSWLNRRMGPPANRYGIRPGRHWDGVDRSTGFEQGLFQQKNEQAQMAQEARMWAQADM